MVNSVGYITKEQFESNVELKQQYGSYEKFMASQLAVQSAFTFARNNPDYALNPSEMFFNMRMKAYDEHNARSEELIENYKELEALYKAMLGEQTSIAEGLQSKYKVSNNGDLLTAMNDKNAFYDQSVYNSATKSTNAAYNAFIAALQTANYQTHRIV